MALILRTNGAPLSGALFVSNPNRQTRRKKKVLALKRNRKNRRNRRNKILLNYHGNRKNRKNRRNPNLWGEGARKTLLNVHGNRKNRKNRRNRRNRRNGIVLQTNRRNRRNGVAVRRNSYGAFTNKATKPITSAVKKVPVVGTVASQYVAPLVMGAAVGAVQYGVMKALKMVPVLSDAIDKVKTVQFTLSGVAAATALRFVPIGSKQIRDQLAVGALLTGAALDMYRYLTEKVGDLGDSLVEWEDEDYLDDLDGLYEDGYIETGDGGAYDVLPLASGTADLGYSGASLVDAHVSPADLSVDEGETALAGPYQWRRRFGPPPHSIRRGGYSSMVNQPGHRFGWLIKLIGFPRFQKIAALDPAKRLALIATLRQQAIATVEASSAVPLATTTSTSAIDMSDATLDMNGELSGLAMNVNDLGALMSAGAAI